MLRRLAFTALALLAIAAPAVASPVVLPSDTPLFFQFVNREQLDTSLLNTIDVPGPYGTAGNWGIVIITGIQTGTVTVPNEDIQGNGVDDVFDTGDGTIYGIFYDIQLTSGTTAIGGTLDLYWSDTAGLFNINATAPDAATVSAFTTGTFLVQIDFASGILGNIGDCTTTIQSNIDVTTITGTGEADSFGNVDTTAGGAWATSLNNDWFNTPCGTRDIRFSNFFNLITSNTDPWFGDGNNIVGLRSNDPARALTTPEAVPEPATLTLLGIGLAGAASRLRRRKKA